MRYILYLIIAFFSIKVIWSQTPYSLKTVPLNELIKENILKGKGPYVSASAETKNIAGNVSEQSLKMTASDLHARSCNWAMRKLSHYEEFPHFIDFIKEARYQESNQQLYFALDSLWMPFRMILIFYIPRIKHAGRYPFDFRDGFLKGLTGEIHLSDEMIQGHKRCLFTLEARWKGPEGPIPSLGLEALVKTILQLGLEKLFRISQ